MEPEAFSFNPDHVPGIVVAITTAYSGIRAGCAEVAHWRKLTLETPLAAFLGGGIIIIANYKLRIPGYRYFHGKFRPQALRYSIIGQ